MFSEVRDLFSDILGVLEYLFREIGNSELAFWGCSGVSQSLASDLRHSAGCVTVLNEVGDRSSWHSGGVRVFRKVGGSDR